MKTLVLRYCAVGAAGFVGAILRYGVATLIGLIGLQFPLGTMVINISGSFFLGWFLTFAGGRHISEVTRLAIGTGFVGAYTTFSTFAYESTRLADQGARVEAMVNLLGSLILGVLAVKLGMILAG